MNPKVDWFFDKDTKWQEEYNTLRAIILECGIKEELKWGSPCYTFQKKNIVLIHGFKGYCALLFHKGVLLNDSHDLLIQQTRNVQAARQMRFTNVEEIAEKAAIIKAYIHEAIDVEKAGRKVAYKKTSEFGMPEEFRKRLEADARLKTAFEALTPGRQRGYLLHFSQPKQSKTRISRIDKCLPKIYEGKGLTDR